MWMFCSTTFYPMLGYWQNSGNVIENISTKMQIYD